MTALIVILVILAVFWLIGMIRLGGRLKYGEAGFYVHILAGPTKIQVLPAPPKKPKKQKPKKEKKPKPEKPPKPKTEGRPGTLQRVWSVLPRVLDAVGALKRRIRVDDFNLTLIWGGSDPASIAIGYGQANAALGALWPLVENNFKVKRRSFDIQMDYGRTEPAVEITAAFTITVGQVLTLVLWHGGRVLIQWVRSGRPAARPSAKDRRQEAKA